MTRPSGLLRVALVHHTREARPAAIVHELAAGLQSLGHEVSLLEGRTELLERPLRARGFTTPLTHIPSTVYALVRGHFDVAHAFSPQDAYAAVLWRRAGGGPVVFSVAEPIERERLSDQRLRLRLLSKALDESDAVIVHDQAAVAAAWRWLALEPEVIAPSDGAVHARLYHRLLAQT